MSNRKTVAILGALLILLLTGVLAWRFTAWHQRGWTGLRYQPPPYEIKGKKQTPPNFGPFTSEPGRIDFVIPGSPADRAGIVPGDKVIRVSGHDISDQESLRRIADNSRTGDLFEYELRRGDAPRIVSIRSMSPLIIPAVVVSIAAACLAALVFVIIAVLVFWYTPRSRSAWVFFWFCSASAFGFALTALTDLDVNNFAGVDAVMLRPGLYVIYGLAGMAGFAVSALLLHLALVFPRERPIVRQHPMVVRWIHLGPWVPLVILTGFIGIGAALPRDTRPVAGGVLFLAGAALAAFLVTRLRRARPVSWKALIDHPWLVSGTVALLTSGLLTLALPIFRRGNPFIFGVVLGLSVVVSYTGLFLAYSIGTLATLIASYRESNVEQKRQVRWPLWGTIVAVSGGLLLATLIVILVTAVPGLNWWVLVGFGAVSRLIYILVPVSFAFAILKYRLMDIDVIIRKTMIYSTVTGFIVVMFFVLVAGLGTWITSSLHVQSQTVTVISTLLLAGSFVPVRNRVQRFVDRRFFRRKFGADQAERAIQQEILHATELQPLLAKIAEVVQQTLQVRSVVILAPRSESGVFVPLAAIGVADAPLRDLSIDRGSIPAGARVVPSSGLRLPEAEHAQLRRMSAELAVPAVLRGQIRGLLVTGTMLSGTYEDDDRDFATRVAEQVALAIDNLAVSDEVRDYERALEIQRALVPTSMPRVEGVDVDAAWRPARIVGGDYFDVFTLGDSLALCIGDVAGKGMPAALLMANLQAAVKATAAPDMPPSAVCQRVSMVVTGTLTGGRFVTFFYATLDRASRTLRYCNAGHNPPLLVRRGGGIAHLQAGGPAFARLMQGTEYVTAEEQLQPGDVVVLFTDGVTEARNAAGEEFGEERLIELVRRGEQRGASVIVRDIIDAVAKFSDGIAHDDVTLVVLRPA